MTNRPVLSVGRRVRLRHVKSAVESLLAPGNRVLDAGCSDGRLAADLAAAHARCEFLAVDVDDEALALARARAEALPNMRAQRAAIGNGEPVDQFDLIVCADVLEHIAEDGAALAWLARSLRPAGHLLLHVPANPQQHAPRVVHQAMEEEIARGAGPHLRLGYCPTRLRELATAAGLTVVDEVWTFHHPLTRLAADVDTWTYLRHARLVKLVLLPFLLAAGELERKPSPSRRGNGLLVHARPSA